MGFDSNDLDLFCLCVWKEARGEGLDGMAAVAHVIANRVGFTGFANNLHDVIMGKNQFTSMSVPTDPQYNLMPGPGDPEYTYIRSIALDIALRVALDITFGAHYYADLKFVTSGWFKTVIENDPLNHPHTVKIGRHDFYV